MPSQPTFDPESTATLEQIGDYGSSTWTEGGSPAPLANWSNSLNLGLTFNFSISTESERSLNLAPTIPYTDVNSDLAGTSETDRAWDLLILPSTLPTSGKAFSLYVMAEPDPNLLFNTLNGLGHPYTHIPDTTNSTPPYLYASYTSSSSVWTQFNIGSVTPLFYILIPIDFSSTLTPVGGSPTTHAINKIVRDPLWNGRLQFFLTMDESYTATIAAVNFSGPTVPFHTGQMGLDIHRRARVVHDYINGFPYLSDEAVEDPFREGVMVHQSSADPPEIRRHTTYNSPASEGVVDDDIPTVE